MTLEVDKYISLLNPESMEDLCRYIKDTAPFSLFKFISLNENNELNFKKFSTLLDDQIWFSSYLNVNDPFELAVLGVDENENYGNRDIDNDKAIQLFKNYVDGVKSKMLFSCFSTNMIDNISMWAYYTNNHQGFCCEYEFIDEMDDFNFDLRPIIYESKIKKISKWEMQRMIALALEQYMNKLSLKLLSEEFFNKRISYDKYITAICSFKDKSWSNEKEYRIYYRVNKETTNGMNVNLVDINLKLKTIYCGVNCSLENKEKLRDIANKLKVEFKETIPSSSEYKLLIK